MSNERKELQTELQALIEVMNANNSRRGSSPYVGFEISETRRKYHLLNCVLSNGQRSGLFLIDVKTHEVFKSVSYGKTDGRRIGTVASLLREYQDANRTMTRTEAF